MELITVSSVWLHIKASSFYLKEVGKTLNFRRVFCIKHVAKQCFFCEMQETSLSLSLSLCRQHYSYWNDLSRSGQNQLPRAMRLFLAAPPFFHILQQNRVQSDRERPFKLYLLTSTLKAVSQYGAWYHRPIDHLLMKQRQKCLLDKFDSGKAYNHTVSSKRARVNPKGLILLIIGYKKNI